MVAIVEASTALAGLGGRLREARLARNEPMSILAQRIGISVPTLRAMEQGADTVQVGHWVRALWALDRLGDLDGVLAFRLSPLAMARLEAQRPKARQRARRRV